MMGVSSKVALCISLMFVLNCYSQVKNNRNKGEYLANSFYYLLENRKIDNSDSVVFITSREPRYAQGYVKGILFKNGKCRSFRFNNGKYRFSWRMKKIPKDMPSYRMLTNLSYDKVNYNGVKKGHPVRGNNEESKFIAFYHRRNGYFKSIHYRVPEIYRDNMSIEKKMFFEGFYWVDNKIKGFKFRKPLSLKNKCLNAHSIIELSERKR